MIKIEIKNIPNLDLDHDLNLACRKAFELDFCNYLIPSIVHIVHAHSLQPIDLKTFAIAFCPFAVVAQFLIC